ncbi:cobalt/nickel ECF transporter CbiMNQO, S component CbiN [Campylobacter blaseri]|uniref:Uncharacterized protein n=1 Tax=Campylobacter blaseri TaxID=2042961 RepID=A0A2P8R0T6_9BACT|nr:hypothetical protein [Campylobacter blaseri]PSM52118.1 hypothetical protein CQ405_03410 [Campylobacter blaseri]PSM53884.1 hypothetical protein CRN67_03410 [Campylobacter blaseri]QKF85318.1 cobalt/nickel ECF transporter CbiMNQO, S component CbiN [Campylobacter blaseri]
MLRVVFLMFLFCFANAHNLEIFPEKDGDILTIKAFMHGSDPCANCLVKITSDKNILATTKTDYKGYAKLEVKENKFEITVTDELAHSKTTLFPLDRNSNLSIFTKFIISFVLLFLIFEIFYLIKRKK